MKLRTIHTPSSGSGGTPGEPSSRRPTRYGKRRAAVLAGVYLLFAIHYLHWKLTAKTLAPIEFNEARYSLELGIVTTGFVFMILAVLATAVFGRFFCSWGCHILALEDLCKWLLARVGIHPRPIRSRFLMWVPLGVMLYMFVWPQAKRLAVHFWPRAAVVLGELPPFDLRIAAEGQGWSSFMTTDFWRNLPGPVMVALTFLVCGFAVVYLLGSRSFCTYICPYGALFGIADRLAPGRVQLTGECTQCGVCTAGCLSNVRVNEEVVLYGKVVDPGCFRDLDCVATCPQGALSYGYSAPALFTQAASPRPKRSFDFTLAEELSLVGIFVIALIIFTGFPHSLAPWAGTLYGIMPLFLSVTLAIITAFVVGHLWRLLRRSEVAFQGHVLKADGGLRRAGLFFVSLSVLWLLFLVQSGAVQYHMFAAGRAVQATLPLAEAAYRQDQAVLAESSPAVRAALWRGEQHLASAESWGLVPDTRISRQRAWFALVRGDSASSQAHMQRAIEIEPTHPDSWYQLGRILALRGAFAEAAAAWAKAERLSGDGGRFSRALEHGTRQLLQLGMQQQALGVLEEAVNLRPDDADLLEDVVRVLRELGRHERALTFSARMLERHPELYDLRVTHAELLLAVGSPAGAMRELERVLASAPHHARANTVMGRTLMYAASRPADAIPYLEEALRSDGTDPQLRADLADACMQIGDLDAAEAHIRHNLDDPTTAAGSYYMLGHLRLRQGRDAEAVECFNEAHKLNPRFPIRGE